MTAPAPAAFQKQGDDVGAVAFGDGGEADLSWPVWQARGLLEEQDRLQLKALLLELAAQRHDIQQNGIVWDIIDPDCFGRRIPEEERAARLQQKVHAEVVDASDTDDSEGEGEDWDPLARWHTPRSDYLWYPTDWGLAHEAFQSPINNLAPMRHRKLHQLLQKAVGRMLPGLREAYQAGKRGARTVYDQPAAPPPFPANRLQVVVKAQQYVLPPGAQYSGRWHTEGMLEKVVAAGVFYVDVDAGLTGGDLKFRPASVPNRGYRRLNEQLGRVNLCVPCPTNSAVTFANIPHRFLAIQNATAGAAARLFVNVFVLDTDAPLPTYAPLYRAHQVLAHHLAKHQVPHDVTAYVWGFVEGTLLGTKALRDRARAAMIVNPSRWGDIHYGNSGHLEFLGCGHFQRQWHEDEARVASHSVGGSSTRGAEDQLEDN